MVLAAEKVADFNGLLLTFRNAAKQDAVSRFPELNTASMEIASNIVGY